MTETLRLEGKLDLSAVGALHAQLCAAGDRSVTLDMRDVTHLGALCLQTCLAAARTARARGHSVTWINTSDRVIGQLSAMGLSPEAVAEGIE